MNSIAVPNPHWSGAPARMADGRQFTEYRSIWNLMPPMPAGPWGGYEQRAQIINAAATQRSSDRAMTVLRGGETNCVDTMVPEVQKKVYSWNGPVIAPGPWQGGIGTGRSYLPGRLDLVGGGSDPDMLAAATFPSALMPGTFEPNPQLYVAGPIRRPVVTSAASGSAGGQPSSQNRYSFPYGN